MSYNIWFSIKTTIRKQLYSTFFDNTFFLKDYFLRNELIWQEGLLIDFLQKKTADAWVRRFVIYTGFLFSERLVFDSIVYIYINNIISNAHSMFIFESSSVSEMLNTLIFYILSLFLISFLVLTLVCLL